jgi:hypothetical protein
MCEEESIIECANLLSDLGCSKSAEQLSIFSNILAITISRGKNANQLNVIGNFIVSVGGLILTMAAQIQACESKQEQLEQINNLKKQIKELEDSL